MADTITAIQTPQTVTLTTANEAELITLPANTRLVRIYSTSDLYWSHYGGSEGSALSPSYTYTASTGPLQVEPIGVSYGSPARNLNGPTIWLEPSGNSQDVIVEALA